MNEKTTSEATSRNRWAFGDFVLDEDQAELRRGSEVIELRAQSFEVLQFLVANPGLKADEIFKAWRDGQRTNKQQSALTGTIAPEWGYVMLRLGRTQEGLTMLAQPSQLEG